MGTPVGRLPSPNHAVQHLTPQQEKVHRPHKKVYIQLPLQAQPLGHWEHAAGHRGVPDRMLVIAAAKKSKPGPSNNIFVRVEQDLLPDGKPNSAWRRLLIIIKATQSLDDLLLVWRSNKHKSLVWRPVHSAAIMMRAALLTYPAALLLPEQLHPGAPPHSAVHPTPTAHTTLQHTQGGQPHLSQASSEFVRSAVQHYPAFLDALPELLTSHPDCTKLLNASTLIRLLVASARLPGHMPAAVLSRINGELLREGARKLRSANVHQLSELASALLHLLPPTPAAVASATGITSVTAMTMTASHSQGHAAGTWAPPAALHTALASVTPNKHSADTDNSSMMVSTQPRQPQAAAQNLERFENYLAMYADAPPANNITISSPRRPQFSRLLLPDDPDSDDGTSGDGSQQQAEGGSRLSQLKVQQLLGRIQPVDATTMWVQLVQAAHGKASQQSHSTAGTGAAPCSTDWCGLATCLAHAGCLSPGLCSAILDHLAPVTGTVAAAAAGEHAVVQLLDWPQHAPVLGSWLRDAWQVALPTPATSGTSAASYQPTAEAGVTDNQQSDDQRIAATLPNNPGALCDLAVAMAVCCTSPAYVAASAGATQHNPFLPLLLAHNGLLERFLWLLPDASLMHITRMCWAVAAVTPHISGMVSSAAGVHAAHRQPVPAACGGPGQHDLSELMQLLLSYVRRAGLTWSPCHVVCMCESLLHLHKHVPAESWAHLVMQPVYNKPALLRAPPDLQARLLHNLVCVSRTIYPSLLPPRPSPGAPQRRVKQRADSVTFENGNVASGDAAYRLRGALRQSLCLLVGALAGGLKTASLSTLCAVLAGVCEARRHGVTDVLQAVGGATERWPLDPALDSWADDPTGAETSQFEYRSVSTDVELLQEAEAASWQLLRDGVHSGSELSLLAHSWRVLGRPDIGRALVARQSSSVA